MGTWRPLNLNRMLHGRQQHSDHPHRTPGCPPVSPCFHQPEWSHCHNSPPIPSAKPGSSGPHAGLCPVGQVQSALGQCSLPQRTLAATRWPRGDPWPLACRPQKPPRPPQLRFPHSARPPEAQAEVSTHPATPLPCRAPGPAASPLRALCFPGGGCCPGVSSIPVSDTGGSRQMPEQWLLPAGDMGGQPQPQPPLPPAPCWPSAQLAALLVPTPAPPSRAALPPSTPAQWNCRSDLSGPLTWLSPSTPACRHPLETRRSQEHTALALF